MTGWIGVDLDASAGHLPPDRLQTPCARGGLKLMELAQAEMFTPDKRDAVIRRAMRTGSYDREWAYLRRKGASNRELREQISEVFGIYGGTGGPGMIPEKHKGGKAPTLELLHGGYLSDDREMLKGRVLVDEVRRVLAIPPALKFKRRRKARERAQSVRTL